MFDNIYDILMYFIAPKMLYMSRFSLLRTNFVLQIHFPTLTSSIAIFSYKKLNINFGVILTLSKKVVQFTQTEETEGCE